MSNGIGFKASIIITALIIIILITGFYLIKSYSPDTIEKVKSKIGTNKTNMTETEQTPPVEEEKSQDTEESTGMLWKFLSVLFFSVIIGLLILLFIRSKTQPDNLKSLEYCISFGQEYIKPQFTPVGNPHVHAYRDRGDHPRFSFLFYLKSFPQNYNFNYIQEEEMVMIDMGRKDPKNDISGPRNMTFKIWEEWINETNKNKRGAMLSPGEPYREGYEQLLGERAFEAAEDQIGRDMVRTQTGVNNG